MKSQKMECRKLEITLVSANNLPDVRSIGRMKVYAKVSTTGKSKTSKKTPVDKEGETNPKWNFTVGFMVTESAIHQPATKVVVELFCKRSMGHDKLVGEVKIPIKSLFDKGLKAKKVISFKVCGTPKGRLNVSYSFGKIVVVQKPSKGKKSKNAVEEGLSVLFDVAISLVAGDAVSGGSGGDEDSDDDGDAEDEDNDDNGDAKDGDDNDGDGDDDDDDEDEDEDDDDEDEDEDNDDNGEEFSRYLPLYKAAITGDWETAKSQFFDRDEEATKAIISYDGETALHVAVQSGKANDFVTKLVEMMPHDALALTDCYGNTALHTAAMVGNAAAARAMVDKNPDLLYIGDLPITWAVEYCQKNVLEYLISVSKPGVERSPFQGKLGIDLLISVISCEFFDVALDLVEKYPDLARLKYDDGSALSYMAEVFQSSGSLSWWEKYTYRCYPLTKAASVVGDIENASSGPPATSMKCSGSFRITATVGQKFGSMIWKVIKHLVPRVKDIGEKKANHEDALKLVQYLCREMASLPQDKAWNMIGHSLIQAASHGVSEIVELIIEMYPVVTCYEGDKSRNIMHLAVSNRFENVFNLTYNMSDRKHYFSNGVDDGGNNLMHICAKLAPPHRLNLVPGAALQMQRELQWFNEMEKFVPPSCVNWPNYDDMTPKMIFTEEHKQLKVEGERWMKDTANACTIASALIATVVFAAAFTVPGGVASESGFPVFTDQLAFKIFAITNAASMFTSITSLLMFLSILTSRYAEGDFLYVLPKRLCLGLSGLFVSITFMLVAFSASLYLLLQNHVRWFLIPVAAFAWLPVASFVLLQFPLLADVVWSTYGPGIFGKKSHRFYF